MPDILLPMPALPGGAARLAAWRVRPGEAVARGATLCAVEQDGRLVAIPAMRAGVVRRLAATPGETLREGAALAELRVEGGAGWTRRLPVPGGTLALRRWGAAPDRACFLLLHGFAGALGNWNGIAPALAQAGTVFAPDLPGHGGTALDAATPAAIAGTLLAALDHVPGGIGRPHLVGHSLGAAVALLMAAKAPARFASLSLISPLGLGEHLRGEFLAGVLAARDIESLAHALSPLTARPMPQDRTGLAIMLAALDRHRPALTALAATLAEGDRQRLDLRATLAALRLPARVLAGGHDAVVSWRELALPPHVPLHLLDCGHMPHWEQPGAVRRVLAQTDWHADTVGGCR